MRFDKAESASEKSLIMVDNRPTGRYPILKIHHRAVAEEGHDDYVAVPAWSDDTSISTKWESESRS